MDSRAQVVSAVAPTLKGKGFRRAALTWRLTMHETILVINFQKSSWSDCFHLNCGVYFRRLGAELNPPESRCHLRVRSERLPQAPMELSRALSFDEHPDLPDRAQRLQRLLQQYAIPWLEARHTEATARQALLAEGPPTGMIAASALDHLGIAAAYRRRLDVSSS